MRLLVMSAVLLVASLSFGSEIRVMCVEKSFAPAALRVSVVNEDDGRLTLKKFASDGSLNVETDISDATYLPTVDGFELTVNRDKSGEASIKKIGNLSTITINLFVPEMKVLNMTSENFSCEGY